MPGASQVFRICQCILFRRTWPSLRLIQIINKNWQQTRLVRETVCGTALVVCVLRRRIVSQSIMSFLFYIANWDRYNLLILLFFSLEHKFSDVVQSTFRNSLYIVTNLEYQHRTGVIWVPMTLIQTVLPLPPANPLRIHSRPLYSLPLFYPFLPCFSIWWLFGEVVGALCTLSSTHRVWLANKQVTLKVVNYLHVSH